MTGVLLALNAGSSSLKFALYDASSLTPLCRGAAAALGAKGQAAHFSAQGSAAEPLAAGAALAPDIDHEGAARWLIERIGARLPELELAVVGHRVVHGGAEFSSPVRVTPEILARLEAYIPLAPGHQPHNLAPIHSLLASRPDLPQIACFDTAFHRTQPRVAQLFPLPRAFAERGVLRYGFHGLSYQFIAQELRRLLPERAQGRVIVAHLGHGASLCAMRGLESVATTMGFTALDGLMMGSRSGAIDPGLLLHLILQEGLSALAVHKLLYDESGLLGVSGISDDLRALEADGSPVAEEAMALFAYRAAREIGSLASALGGLDCLVFTAGIGENSPTMRARICGYLGYLGVALDDAANARGALSIGAGAAEVLVVATNEEAVIAEAARGLWREGAAGR
ncbi:MULTISPECIES: acetate/propionate family kinase [Methylosinus]|uniref:Acetate kinase n=1 Tax=Methylosinus trichosporium (strain ATCC 35070 / NCIMB 11131 / UNIQEM 75 / OB3b) TaxID=595536 RepID=A0A2D2D2G4_METT3|nr:MULTISPECIES: acetate/propionate family kinase [Methylosinus]ATQ69175.1 acetate/propionate family kinase [Methylosinus trichosporium OB3b]OBS53598.1 acetate kinase [Methylosinus sp. 3S-1]